MTVCKDPCTGTEPGALGGAEGWEEGAGVSLGQRTDWASTPRDNLNSSLAPGLGLGLHDNGLEIGQVLGEGQAARPSS